MITRHDKVDMMTKVWVGIIGVMTVLAAIYFAGIIVG